MFFLPNPDCDNKVNKLDYTVWTLDSTDSKTISVGSGFRIQTPASQNLRSASIMWG